MAFLAILCQFVPIDVTFRRVCVNLASLFPPFVFLTKGACDALQVIWSSICFVLEERLFISLSNLKEKPFMLV